MAWDLGALRGRLRFVGRLDSIAFETVLLSVCLPLIGAQTGTKPNFVVFPCARLYNFPVAVAWEVIFTDALPRGRLFGSTTR